VQPFITALSINNIPTRIATDNFIEDPLQLSYKENNIQFDYTAIDYTNSEKITFAYMLEGFDNDWVTANTNRKVNYANLKGGEYTFKLKACNSSGLWNESYAKFKFYIKPPFWQRWWFWPVLALIFITVVLFVARKRIENIRQKEKQKTALHKAMAELETKMLRSQMNPHFIFNSLNSVQKYIWENKEEDAAEYLASFAKLIRAILENSRKETISLKEEIDVIKLYIELEHRRSNAHFDQDKVRIPPMLMQPFIENAIWHGLNKKEAKGNLKIIVLRQDQQLVCIIDDDGVGRQQSAGNNAEERKSLGMEITQQRINRLMETSNQNASVVITDKKENAVATGTTVTITLPL